MGDSVALVAAGFIVSSVGLNGALAEGLSNTWLGWPGRAFARAVTLRGCLAKGRDSRFRCRWFDRDRDGD